MANRHDKRASKATEAKRMAGPPARPGIIDVSKTTEMSTRPDRGHGCENCETCDFSADRALLRKIVDVGRKEQIDAGATQGIASYWPGDETLCLYDPIGKSVKSWNWCRHWEAKGKTKDEN